MSMQDTATTGESTKDKRDRLRLYNTLSAQKEEFVPTGNTEAGEPVKMYVCGVTPYDESHVGHAMSYIIFDVIRRYLVYRGYNVRYVQNFTDIDDKLIARAHRLNSSVKELAEIYISKYFDDMKKLNVLSADLYVRATDTIDKIIEVIQGLIDKGYAYPAHGDVYFRVTKDEDYGELSHRNIEDMQAGARIEVGVIKEHPMDFVLWKSAKPGEPSWESPWGPGRPGWHIECSAMILEHLGETIDIHGGGHDLIFPHHENEIAQSESFTGKHPFVKYWLHNGLLQLGSEKMSKSLGNLVTIKEALEKTSADGLRMFILGSHYRAPLTYTDEGLAAADKGVSRLRAALRDFDPANADSAVQTGPVAEAAEKAKAAFISMMDDDFNTSASFASLFDLVREINRARESGASAAELHPAQATIKELAEVLGMTLEGGSEDDEGEVAAKPFVDLLISIRADLRTAKQWALADKVRDSLTELGVVLEDRAGGTSWRIER